jgi:hypothetical protein
MTLQLSAVPNGTLTVTNRATGAHRTFRVKTWRKKGRRVVEMLTGPENTRDYTAFAFVDEERRAVSLWSRFQLGDWPRLAEVVRVVLFDEAHPWRAQLDVQLSRTCIRCNRLLTTPESIERGIGPECEQRS